MRWMYSHGDCIALGICGTWVHDIRGRMDDCSVYACCREHNQKGSKSMAEIQMRCEEIRKQFEKEGCCLTNEEYRNLVKYARRKMSLAGKDESYLPYLLTDVIKEFFIRNAVNAFSVEMMEVAKY